MRRPFVQGASHSQSSHVSSRRLYSTHTVDEKYLEDCAWQIFTAKHADRGTKLLSSLERNLSALSLKEGYMIQDLVLSLEDEMRRQTLTHGQAESVGHCGWKCGATNDSAQKRLSLQLFSL